MLRKINGDCPGGGHREASPVPTSRMNLRPFEFPIRVCRTIDVMVPSAKGLVSLAAQALAAVALLGALLLLRADPSLFASLTASHAGVAMMLLYVALTGQPPGAKVIEIFMAAKTGAAPPGGT